MKNKNYIFLSRIKFDVLDFIKNYIKHYQYPPTYKEIGEKFKFTKARAGAIIAELYKLKLINKNNQTQRNIELTNKQLKQISHLKINKNYSTMEFRK